MVEQNQKLENAKATGYETYDIAMQIQENMHENTGKIHHADSNVSQFNYFLKLFIVGKGIRISFTWH